MKQPPDVKILDDAQTASLSSGELTARVEKASDWRIDFMDGDRLITNSSWRGMGFVDTSDGKYIPTRTADWLPQCRLSCGRRLRRSPCLRGRR